MLYEILYFKQDKGEGGGEQLQYCFINGLRLFYLVSVLFLPAL